ncbi:MAG: citrate synthase/methylcitrate synthase [Anaerolineales bacterium]
MNNLNEAILQSSDYIPGLEGVVAAQTRLSRVDGRAGQLIIAGFPLEEIAPRASFEEMVYLLWTDDLPNLRQYSEFRDALAQNRSLPQAGMDLLIATAAARTNGMDALRITAGALGLNSPPDQDAWAENLAILGRLPTLVAAFWRLRNGEQPLEPRSDLGYAANYLYMLTGDVPREAQVRALETYLNAVVDHGMNASTFTARVIVSTGSDLLSALVGAIGALKGPLHGGAPGPAMDMVLEIGEASRAEAYLREKLERGERLMGFGHRVYKVRDPRADVLAVAAERLYQQAGDMKLYELAKAVESKALELLEEYKPGRHLQTNVEYYTALVLQGLGLPVELFSPTFAISRAAGWIAHSREQQRQNRIIRPKSQYTGLVDRKWTPLEART